MPLPSQFLPQSGSSDCVLEAVGPLVITIVMKAVEALTLISGRVSHEILLRNEYLAAENEILRSRLGKRIALSRSERIRLAKLGKKLGKRALHGVSTIVKPETILGWYRSLVAQKFDGSKNRKKQGRPRVDVAVERLVLEMAEANASWGYDRIVGALRNLGYDISDQTVGNILRRNGIPPVPRRKPAISWTDFIKMHEDVLVACDFFTAEVFTPAGLVTYYVLFFIKIGSRDVHIAGMTPHPNEAWMMQVARNVTMDDWGFLDGQRYLIHDRDSKFSAAFGEMMRSAGVEPLKLPPRSPDLNAFAERWVRSVKSESLSRLILFGENSLRHVLAEFSSHYREERNHQGKDNVLLFPSADHVLRTNDEPIECKERLGGLLKFYHRKAA